MEELKQKPAISQAEQQLILVERQLDYLRRVPEQRSLTITQIEPMPRRAALIQERTRLLGIIQQEQARQNTQVDNKPEE